MSSKLTTPLIYFPHIPKTGGQTLLVGFYRAFGFDACLKVWDPRFGADIEVKAFPGVSAEKLQTVAAVVGHLPCRVFFENPFFLDKENRNNLFILTCVRNPIERMLSLYNYITNFPEHPYHAYLINTPVDDFLLKQPCNYQFKFLSSMYTDSLEGITIIPIEHSVSVFCNFIKSFSGKIIDSLEARNSSENFGEKNKLVRLDDLPAQVVEQLMNKNDLDFQMYHKALSEYS